jgi:drug/metabolite transporter (DMT)-like permease
MDISNYTRDGQGSKKRDAPSLYTILGLVAILIWSTTVALARSATEQVGPLTSAALIYLLGGTLGCAYWAASGTTPRLSSLDRRYLVGCGALFVLYQFSVYVGLGTARDRTQVLGVGLLNYLWPMLTLVFSLLLLKIKATALVIPGVLAATAGVFFVMTQGESLSQVLSAPGSRQSIIPYGLGLTAGISWGLYSALSRKWAGDAEGSAAPVFMLAAGTILGLLRFVFHEQSTWSTRATLELLYLAIGPNVAYLFWERAMQRGDIILVASCSYFTPLLSTIISRYYLGVSLSWRLWLGCVLIITGAFACNLAVRRAKPSPAPQERLPETGTGI